MKHLRILIIVLGFYSCTPNENIQKSQKFYRKGVAVLGQVDSLGNQNYSKALLLFDNSIKFNEDHIEAKFWKTQCQIHLGKLDNALSTSIDAINYFKESDHILVSNFLITAGLIEGVNLNLIKSHEYFELALEVYDERINKNIDDLDAIMNKATVLCYMSRKQEAIEFINSISICDDNELLLNQIKESILTLDYTSILDVIKNNKW